LACRPTAEVDLSDVSVQELEKMLAAGDIPPFLVGAKCKF
jgi:hypothetical protein